MASVDLTRSCLDSIRQISDEISNAVLYLDAGCLEAFQFIGAFPLLLELGVRVVCSLENMSSLDTSVDWNSNFVDPARKMVVITSRLLSDAHRYILRCLGTHQTILQCMIFTSISEMAHSTYVDSPLGPDAFHEYETLLLQDYEELVKKYKKKGSSHRHDGIGESAGVHEEKLASENDGWSQMTGSEDYEPNAGSSERDIYGDDSIGSTNREDGSTRLLISVQHFPMILCPISPSVFVFPSEGIIAEASLANAHEDSFSPGLPSISTGLPSDGDDVSPGVTLTAHFLYHLAAKMDLKMDIFSLGDTSKIIGKMLTDMSSLYDVGRRNKRSAGLLLIDRTLDLLTPCSHGDSFLDRIISSLPRKERSMFSTAVKNSQTPTKHSPVNLQRPPLDIRIPFTTLFSKKDPVMSNTQLSESVTSFISGWNSTEVGSETADSADHADTVHDNSLNYELSLLSGSFLSNYTGSKYLEALIDRRANDGALLIKKRLLEALQHEKIPVSYKGRLSSATASELRALVEKLALNQMSLIRNRGIIQLALAAEIALSEPYGSRWDAFVSAERILNVSSIDTSQSLASQIRDLINTSTSVRSNEQHESRKSSQALLSFQDALLLAVTGYILAGENFPTSGATGPFSWEEEHHLKEAVVDAILERATAEKLQFLLGLEKELEANSRKEESMQNEDAFPEPSKGDDFDDQWDSWGDEDTDQQSDQAYGDMQFKLELRDRVDHLFKFFHKLSGLRWRIPSLREGLIASISNSGTDPYARKGLLYKLLTTILAKYDIPGLEYHSSAVGRFFKSGFGRFGLGQAKPSFGDQNVLLIFVVGGINSLEVREVMEALSESSRPDLEFLLGGTTLLTPDDMFELLLGSSSYI